jgi:hypothetical protein
LGLLSRICRYIGLFSANKFILINNPTVINEILINAIIPIPTEELIAATLRQMSRVREDSHSFMVAAGKELANLLSSNIARLKNILERIKHD